MPAQRNSTRQRLINAALELFATQGVAETTTRQIAELAQVNEVTLFRHFGNKHGLLLAVISESAVFKDLGESLRKQAEQPGNVSQALRDYASDRLQALEQVPLVLSVVGEARQYPVENRIALGRGLTQVNRYVAEYLATVMEREQLHTRLSAEKLASLLNSLLLGYAVIEFTSEFHQFWHNRDEFLESLVELFLGAVSGSPPNSLEQGGNTRESKNGMMTTPESASADKVADLPTNLVHLILQRAKKGGLQDYALMYVLFGAGLSVVEIVNLERSHQIIDAHQHLLQITQGNVRQVPVNQWIMDKHYGSYTRNPLTQWLKSRKDERSALFLNEAGVPISESEIHLRWQESTEELLTPEGQPPAIEQAQQTWCVEMLMKGMELEDLSILTGWNSIKLQPYARRAREKLALEQAIRLDQKS